jgi:hypothetical protein
MGVVQVAKPRPSKTQGVPPTKTSMWSRYLPRDMIEGLHGVYGYQRIGYHRESENDA